VEKEISIQLKKNLVHLLVIFLKLLIFLGKAVSLLCRYLIIKPLEIIGKFIFHFFVVRLYKIYLLAKNQIRAIYRPAKGKLLYPLSTRYIVHALVILLTILVVTNSLNAKETNEEFGQTSLLASLVQPFQEGMITETSDSASQTATSFMETSGNVVGVPKMGEGTEPKEEATVTKEGAIIKPNLVATTIGERPREEVIYHEVQGGETVSEIAARYGISTDTILWENKLGPRDFIKPGQKLTILPTSGASYQVKSGDTLEKIAQKYSVDVNGIIDFNNLPAAEAILVDQILILPGGTPPAPPTPVIEPRSRFASLQDFFSPTGAVDATPNYGTNLQWPTPSRKINQYFSWRHTGVDIDGTYTSPIYAADTGRVEAAGWQSGYGLRIVVNHGNGIKTLYGHLSKTHVSVGDSVSRGQTIATMGCTGWCTGTHLHFEVIIGGRKLNPLNYL